MPSHPTDLQLLQAIYDRYYKDFVYFDHDSSTRKSKVFVPIDIPAIASVLDYDAELVFGRMYYHLEKKHGLRNSNGTRTSFFEIELGGQKHCVNFPMLASILAELRDENVKFQWPLWISGASFIVSIAALVVSILFR